MRLRNHIALRFLTDDTLAFEIMESMHPGEIKKLLAGANLNDKEHSKVLTLWNLVNNRKQTAYVVTETVHDKLDMLKVKRNGAGWFDWTVFGEVKDCKKTFILYPQPESNGGGCLRIVIDRDTIEFCHLHFKLNKGDKELGLAHWTLFYINRKTNEHADHCSHQDVKDIYEFVYKLLCFIFLSENEYEVLQPGQSKGTKKSGKVLNELPVPVTIINSKWNVTSIRSEGFWVSAHFALRRCGPGRTASRVVFINAFEKEGYVRGAANKELQNK